MPDNGSLAIFISNHRAIIHSDGLLKEALIDYQRNKVMTFDYAIRGNFETTLQRNALDPVDVVLLSDDQDISDHARNIGLTVVNHNKSDSEKVVQELAEALKAKGYRPLPVF